MHGASVSYLASALVFVADFGEAVACCFKILVGWEGYFQDRFNIAVTRWR